MGVTGGGDAFMRAAFDSPSVNRFFSDMSPQTRTMTLQVLLNRLRMTVSSHNITREQLNTVIVQPGATPSSSRESVSDGQRAAKRLKKSEEEKVDVGALWEEMKSNVEEENNES